MSDANGGGAVVSGLVQARSRSLDDVVARRHVIVCTGAGGVGKTTTAAALAIEAARRGRRTIVLTIDPARRLAQSLGLSRLDTAPRPVPGVDGLDAMMLDMKRTFDEIVERHATSPDRVQRILDNRFYQQLSASLAGTQEYMAMEKLYDLDQTGRYDCIVIDTPPTRNALDFLDAPKRLTDFLEGRFLKMFLSPGIAAGRFATRAVGVGTGLFMRAASRVTGAVVLDDLAEFFQSFEGMYEGFKQRAQAVYHLLQRPDSAFVVVSSPEPPSLREASYFLRRLARDGMPTAGVVVNRVTVAPGGHVGAAPTAELMEAAAALNPDDDIERATAVLLELAIEARAIVGRQQQAIEAAFHGLTPPRLVEVPLAGGDVHDVDGLRWIADHLTGATAA
ncbi:MAG: AAA family ATPase [Actinobacteria bacterium]|nr:AAA family ATPase [Actinomycetota bacterium]